MNPLQYFNNNRSKKDTSAQETPREQTPVTEERNPGISVPRFADNWTDGVTVPNATPVPRIMTGGGGDRVAVFNRARLRANMGIGEPQTRGIERRTDFWERAVHGNSRLVRYVDFIEYKRNLPVQWEQIYQRNTRFPGMEQRTVPEYIVDHVDATGVTHWIPNPEYDG